MWINQFLSQSQQGGAAGLVLQREDLQAELQALERKILAKVLEDQRLSAQDAQAGTGVALQQGGAAGVTEEVSTGLSLRDVMVTTGVGLGGCAPLPVCSGGWCSYLVDGRAMGTALTARPSILGSHCNWQEHP